MVKKTEIIFERTKVKCYIQHQAIAICPECGYFHATNLGENDSAEFIEIDCQCGCKFILGEVNNG